MNATTVELAGDDWPVVSCRDCGAPMVWCITAKTEKPIPIDVMPVEPSSKVYRTLVVDGTSTSPRGGTAPRVAWARGEDSTRPRYTTHFATCPDRQPTAPPSP